MARRLRPWYQVATPEQKRSLIAQNWRRQIDAMLFRAAHTQGSDDASQIIQKTTDAWKKNPLGPKAEDDPLAPPEVQLAADQEAYNRRRAAGGPVPGVPLGVAEAFPEQAQDRRVYGQPGSTGEAGEFLKDIAKDKPIVSDERLPGPARTLVEEMTRPSNLLIATGAPARVLRGGGRVGAIGAKLVAPSAGGFARRLLTEAGASAGARTAATEVGERLPKDTNPALGVAAQLVAGLAGGATGGGLAAASPRAATRFRDITQDVPVGASIKDVSGALPEDLAGGGAPSFKDALNELKKAVSTEARLRNRGVVEGEIKAGRGAQFGGVRQSLEQGIQSGLGGEELARQARRGAATGPLRRTVAEPVNITQAQRDALFDEVMTKVADPNVEVGQFLTASRALEKALNGDGLQPHEIRALQPLLGNDITTALVDRAPKPAPTPKMNIPGSRGGGPRLGGKAVLPESQIEVPTVGRGRQARPESMGSLTKANIAEEAAARKRMLDEQAARLRRSAPDLLEPIRPERPTEFPSSTAGIPTRGTTRDLLTDPRAEQHRVSGIRQGLKSAAAEELKRSGPSEDALMQKARQLLSTEERTLDLPGAPRVKAQKREVEETINTWLQGNRDILDNMGPEGNQLIQNINAQITGDVADSYLSAALSRRNILAESLRSTWGDVPDAAKATERDKIITKVTDALFERELKVRYKGEVPERARDLLKTARPLPYEESLGWIATATQRAKNTMFGVADVSIFGVQGLSAVRRGGIPMFAAMINRGLAAMHMPNVGTTYADIALPKQVQYGLDGVKQGAATGVFARKQGQREIGSVLQYLGKPGRVLDRPFMAAADKMSQWQFGTVLGGLRNLAYEGDLVLLKMTRQDITKPNVRRQAAANANMIGSFAESALRRKRASYEGAALLTAPMFRSRVAHITQMAKLLGPKSSPTERVLAATTIMSTVGITLALGKFLNDWIGVGDFQFDPSKPGFGRITTADGLVIDVIPQDSVEKAFVSSLRAINESDPRMAAEAWGKLFIGSAGPFPRAGMAAVDVGYQPGSGYHFGDLPGQGLLENTLNLAPIPPLARSVQLEGFDPLGTVLEAGGIANFPESGIAETSRVFKQQTGGEFEKATTAQKREFYGQNPELAKKLDEETLKQAAKGDRDAQARAVGIETRQRLNELADKPGMTVADYREQSRTITLEQRGKLSAYEDVIAGWGQSENEVERLTSQYYDLFDQAKGPGGVIDYEKFDELEARFAQQLGPKFAEVQANIGAIDPRDNPMQQQVEKTRNALAASGFFDMRDQAWSELQSLLDGDMQREAMQFTDFYYYKEELTLQLTQRLLDEGFSKSVARARAEVVVENAGPIKAFTKLMQRNRIMWAEQNQQLAEQAIEAGYLSASGANIGAAGAIQTPTGRTR